MRNRQWVKKLIVGLAGFIMLPMMVMQPSQHADAAISISDLKANWKPLQNPEPVAGKNNFTYGRLCFLDNQSWVNHETFDYANGGSQVWFRRDMGVCDLVNGGARISPIYNPDEEKNGYYTFEAYFNQSGIVNDQLYTSNPQFHIMWGNNWDLDSVNITPISGYSGWGPASQPIQNISVNMNVASCYTNDRGYCQPGEITWPGYVDPYLGGDGELFRWPQLHRRSPANGIPYGSNYTEYLSSGDGYTFNGTKWWKPELNRISKIEKSSDIMPVNNSTDLVNRIGGNFSIEYNNAQPRENKRARMIFKLKRKPNTPVTETPFVGAVYKSWDKNNVWVMGDFLAQDPVTREYYEPLRVHETIKQNSYSSGKVIPQHLLKIKYGNDSTDYIEPAGPARAPGTCAWETSFTRQYRYKVFNVPSKSNEYAIPALRDPDTGRESVFESRYNQFTKQTWWETDYKGYRVYLYGSPTKDADGVANYRMEWEPNQNTPTVSNKAFGTITIDVYPDSRKFDMDLDQPNAARLYIALKYSDGSYVEPGVRAVVEVTKPDGSKPTYNTVTGKQGLLQNTDGSPLKTASDQAGKYTNISVIKLAKDLSTSASAPLEAVDSCVTVDRQFDHYEVVDAGRYIEIQKVDANGRPLKGAAIELYPDKNGKPDLSGKSTMVPPDGKLYDPYPETVNTSWVTWNPLALGKYWLVETKAPFGHELAQPIPFTLEANRIVLGNSNNDKYTVTVTGNKATPLTYSAFTRKNAKVLDVHVIKIQDVQTATLPASGGPGHFIWLIAGSGLLALSFLIRRGVSR